jgi:ureidoglycolate lyase
MISLSIAPLTKAGFAPFGEVVETADVKPKLINEGFAERFDDLAGIDVPSSYRAFAASGRQGVNYARNCWHHPLLVVGDASPFVVIDRKGPGSNLEERWLEEANWLRVAPDGAVAAYSDLTAKRG